MTGNINWSNNIDKILLQEAKETSRLHQYFLLQHYVVECQ